jgi:TonB family protein
VSSTDSIVVFQAGSTLGDKSLLRDIRGPLWQSLDKRFFFIALASLALHIGIVWYLDSIKLKQNEMMAVEKIPERFAKLIIDKPMPKLPPTPKQPLAKTAETGEAARQTAAEETAPEAAQNGQAAPVSAKERAVAQKAVARQVARVEEKIRTVGVLGMLTGQGSTARGPAVVDVLGGVGKKKESFQNLESALSNMSGLQQTQNINVLQSKLVKSKDVSINRKEEIDDLIASVGAAKATNLAKRGSITIQRPQSIEGAASSNAKRDYEVINAVVLSHKTSINMSYEKYLKIDPGLAGKITIRLTIAASGDVSAATVIENTTGNRDLEDDIVRKVRMWKFDPIPEGDATVTLPLVFSQAQGQG